MIVVLCNACMTAARVFGEEAELYSLIGEGSQFWPDKFKCVRCEGPAMGVNEAQIDVTLVPALTWKEYTAQELFSIQMGLGPPEERGCDVETVRSIFKQQRVVQVQGKTVPNTTRTTIDCLIFADGTRLYLGASSHGAVVYRIAKPFTGEVRAT